MRIDYSFVSENYMASGSETVPSKPRLSKDNLDEAMNVCLNILDKYFNLFTTPGCMLEISLDAFYFNFFVRKENMSEGQPVSVNICAYDDNDCANDMSAKAWKKDGKWIYELVQPEEPTVAYGEDELQDEGPMEKLQAEDPEKENASEYAVNPGEDMLNTVSEDRPAKEISPTNLVRNTIRDIILAKEFEIKDDNHITFKVKTDASVVDAVDFGKLYNYFTSPDLDGGAWDRVTFFVSPDKQTILVNLYF